MEHSNCDRKWRKSNKTRSIIKNIAILLTIFILQGAGILNYKDSTLNIFISGGIAEIYVLVRVIVKYLFKDNLTETLKIIISTNNTNKTYRKENKKIKTTPEKTSL